MAFLPLLVLLALSGGVLGAVRDDLCKSPQCKTIQHCLHARGLQFSPHTHTAGSWIKLKKEEARN